MGLVWRERLLHGLTCEIKIRVDGKDMFPINNSLGPPIFYRRLSRRLCGGQRAVGPGHHNGYGGRIMSHHCVASQTVTAQAVTAMTPYDPRNGIHSDRGVGANCLMMYGRQRCVPGLLYGSNSRIGLSKQITEEQEAWKKEKKKFLHVQIIGHKSII